MTMNRSMDQLMAGAEVYGSDNEKIGTIADVGQNYFLVQKGFLFIKDLYLPTRTIARTEGDRVYLSVPKHEAESMAAEQLPAEGDAWYGTTTGRGTMRTTTDTADMTNRGTYTTDREVTTGTTGRTTGRTERAVTGNEDISVPVVEEELQAGVRERQAGSARIVKNVTSEQQSIDVPVKHEEVYVTERAVNRPATEADLSAMDRDIEIPLTEQEVVTQKTAMVTGEVTIRKDVTTENQRVTDTVRREEVHVEGGNTEHVHVEGMNDTQRGWFSNLSREEQMRYRDMSPADRTTYEREYNARSGRGEGVVDKAKDAVRNVENKGRDR